jgi:hypothetical protein
MLVSTYIDTWCHSPEDHIENTHLYENPKTCTSTLILRILHGLWFWMYINDVNKMKSVVISSQINTNSKADIDA